MEKVKKIRLSLDVTPPMKEIIEELASEMGTNQGEVLRRAIALLRAAKKVEKDGEQLCATKDGKTVSCKLVGF